MVSSLLFQEPANHWSYKAEGNANIVFSYVGNAAALFGKVLKVRKLNAKTRNRLSPEYQLLPHDPLDFAENIMTPLLGKSYSSVGERVFVPSEYLRRLNDSLDEASHRSFSRKGQDIDTMFPYVVIMKDRTLLPRVNSGNARMEDEQVVSFGVEIKPKCGNLPYIDEVSLYCRERNNPNHSEPESELHAESFCSPMPNYSCSDIGYDDSTFKCRFCIQQVHKSIRNRPGIDDSYDCLGDDPTPISMDRTTPGTTTPDAHPGHSPRSTSSPCSSMCSSVCIVCDVDSSDIDFPPPSSLSRYCPLDLFSLDHARMLRAVSGLFSTPQNNFRVFLSERPGAPMQMKKKHSTMGKKHSSQRKTSSNAFDSQVKELYGEKVSVDDDTGKRHTDTLEILDPVLDKLAKLPLFTQLRELEKLHRHTRQHDPHHLMDTSDCLLGWIQVTSNSTTTKIPFPHTEHILKQYPPTVTDAHGVVTTLPYSCLSILFESDDTSDTSDTPGTRYTATSETVALLFLLSNSLRSGPVLTRIRALQALDRGLFGGIGSGGPGEAADAVGKVVSILHSILPSLEKQPLSFDDDVSFLEIEAILAYALHSKEMLFDAVTEVTNHQHPVVYTPPPSGRLPHVPGADAVSHRPVALPNPHRVTDVSSVRVLVQSLLRWKNRVRTSSSTPAGGDDGDDGNGCGQPSSLFVPGTCDLSPEWLETLQSEMDKYCSKDDLKTVQIVALSLVAFLVSATAKDCSILIALEGVPTAPGTPSAPETLVGQEYGGAVVSEDFTTRRTPPMRGSPSSETNGKWHHADRGQHEPEHDNNYNNNNSSDNIESCTISFIPNFIITSEKILDNGPNNHHHRPSSPRVDITAEGLCSRPQARNTADSRLGNSNSTKTTITPSEFACVSQQFCTSAKDCIIELSSTSVQFHFSLGIVDLDPKPFRRIPKYKVQDEVIRSLWSSAVKQWTLDSEL